ncbi:porin family protein [Bacteroides propionicifaciens]|uniref:porin family protein n=1 Tax=Bacteroides propionicifaciens TaxID=392838 RepID=UPI00036E18A3|nr:porin family protein [Bacteroides propionicifaciens]
MKLTKNILVLVMLISSVSVLAQSDRNRGIIWSSLRGLEYEVKAGINIGGASPIPLPSEIRKIDSYRPDLALSLGAEVSKWFGVKEQYGFIFGLTIESKSMRTDAQVKNYGMKIIGNGGEEVSGQWTGNVVTKFRTSNLTLPLLFGYKVSNRVNLKVGPYFSYVLERDFSGHVYDGYLREGDPTGPKVVYEGENKATYDFSKDLRKFQWGLRLGTEWRAFKHLNVFADLNWGLNDIFKKDFDTVTFSMYPIYLNVGFGYAF